MNDLPELIFASNNAHKLKEIKALLPPGIRLLSLAEAQINTAMDEPFATLEDNALAKARQIKLLSGKDCFAEDSGLETEALNHEPGVFSARYAGEPTNDKANMDKLLLRLGNHSNRKARFRTVIALIWNNGEHLFEGICEGEIAMAPAGSGGFGYDPVFIPKGFTQSFAQMTAAEKNQISHRAKATAKLLAFLHNVMP